jgi:hypothetical protein
MPLFSLQNKVRYVTTFQTIFAPFNNNVFTTEAINQHMYLTLMFIMFVTPEAGVPEHVLSMFVWG